MDDDTASIKKGGRTPLFSSMAVNAFRRRELSLGLSPTSNPALSSLLETQKRDEAARNKSQTHLQTPVPPPTPFPAPAPTIAPTPAAPVPARPQPQARSRTRSQTPPRSRTPPRRDISADGYHSGTGSDSEGEPKSVRERRSLAMRLGRLAKSNSLTRVFGLNRKRRTSETSIDQHVSRTSSRATTPKSAEWPAGPIMVDSPPAIVTPPLEPVAPAAAPAAQPQVIPIPAPELEPVQALVQALAKLGDVALDVADLGHDIEFETGSDGVKGGQGDVYRAFLGPRRTLLSKYFGRVVSKA
ncbi:hypothetical protein FRB99_006891 [Tulasnella sp. 403]|nr:hypothetical protein FRB99_006891 [Tulasnella sp. 403]